jgi:integrase
MSHIIDQYMSFSIQAVINSRRIKKNGTASIYLRIIINRQFKDLPLDLSWHVDLWKNEKCQPTNKKCTVANDYNLIIDAAKSKAHEIFVQYRLRNLPLSLDVFMKEYRSNLNRDDFVVYYRQKMLQRLKEKEITESSVKSHKVTLKYLERWKKEFMFSGLDERTAIQFDEWLFKKTGANSINGRWSHHRNFKTYLNFAKKDKIQFINPYDFFTAKQTMGRFQPLTFAQFMDIWDAYQGDWYGAKDRDVVRAFLFACFTGMRHSDVRRMNIEWMDGDFIEFIPYKTRKHGTKVRVPATPEALKLLSQEIADSRRSVLFCSISEQKQNEAMREIGKQIGFKGNLCFQVARETFATLYMENGGKLEVLASFLGHTSTKMSEKYIKIRDSRKREEADKISGFIKTKN